MDEHESVSYAVTSATTPSSSSGGGGDSSYASLRRKAHNAFGYIRERLAELDFASSGSSMSAEAKQTKLEQNAQFIDFEKEARQVLQRIGCEEASLARACPPPRDAASAEQLYDFLEQKRSELQEVYGSACLLLAKADAMESEGHSETVAIRSLSASVSTRWHCLASLAEERLKLCSSASAWFSAVEAVCTLLERCDREYSHMTCSGDGAGSAAATAADATTVAAAAAAWEELHGSIDQESLLRSLVADHVAHKEELLKACTDARHAAQAHLKYARRYAQQANAAGLEEVRHVESDVKDILERVHRLEMEVLSKWATKKSWLERCLSEIAPSTPADGSIAGAEPLASRKSVVSTGSSSGRGSWPSQQEDGEWIQEVVVVTPTSRPLMWKESRVSLEQTTCTESCQHPMQDLSDADYLAMAEMLSQHEAWLSADENRRKSLKKREYIMAELLQTERAYVEDLTYCLQYYLREMKNGITPVPARLDGKHSVIFGNLEEIANFHQTVFLPELEQYIAMPEVVGHCFVAWAERFSMYVTYCQNKPASTELLLEHGAEEYFASIQKKYVFVETLGSYLIKPVQRITRYQLLLKDLMSCCENGRGELREGLEVMLSLPKKANDMMHLKMLRGLESDSVSSFGDLLLQDKFVVCEGKSKIVNKNRSRQVFLFENCMVLAKEHAESTRTAYALKSVIPLSEIAVSEHIEGDDCKLGLWTSAMSSAHRKRLVLKCRSLSVKTLWSTSVGELLSNRLLRLDGGVGSDMTGDSFPRWSPSPLSQPRSPEDEPGSISWQKVRTIVRRNTMNNGSKCNGLRLPSETSSSTLSTPRNSRCSNGSLSSAEL